MEKTNNNKKMWAILLHLGTNMWCKPGSSNYRTSLFCDEDAWKNLTAFLPESGINTLLVDVGEGIAFDSHPELAIDGTWSKKKAKEDLKRIRDLGVTPIPKFNFSSGHCGFLGPYSNMVGSPTYLKVCSDLIEETAELFDGPEFFHLGLEEETAEDMGNFPIAVVRNHYKLMEDAHVLFNATRKAGCRPWMWADPNLVTTFGGDKDFCHNVPKDVLLSNWYYGFVSPDYKNSEALCSHSGRIEVYNKLDEWGYEQVPACSTYIDARNQEQTMKYCKETFKNPDNLRGFISAPWSITMRENYNGLRHDAHSFGLAKKKIYPECE